MKDSLRKTAQRLKRDIKALYLVSRRSDVPLYTKLFVIIIVGYALSPIDLIPDFIPILGYVDDLIIIPLGIWLALRLIPESIMEECRLEAEQTIASTKMSTWVAGGLIILLWIIIVYILLKRIVA
ncbi:MAG: YkvA family protein [Methanomethylovorans sp.]|uniref:YkvA family protein n=1 Tax=Methanomethylovorans sp. TaxID=2758717 RepID=UPI0035307BB2